MTFLINGRKYFKKIHSELKTQKQIKATVVIYSSHMTAGILFNLYLNLI